MPSRSGSSSGYLLGGRLDRLGTVRFRWAPLAVARAGRPGRALLRPLGRPSSVTPGRRSTSPRRPPCSSPSCATSTSGPPARGARRGINLVAIVANGGNMPRRPDALASVGWNPAGYSNSAVVAEPGPRAVDRHLRAPGLGAVRQRVQHRRRADRRRHRQSRSPSRCARAAPTAPEAADRARSAGHCASRASVRGCTPVLR